MVIVFLERDPGQRVLAAQMDHPPLAKQGGLAKTGRSRTEGELSIHPLGKKFAQARAGHQVRVRPRYVELGGEQRFGRGQPPIEQDRSSVPCPTQALYRSRLLPITVVFTLRNHNHIRLCQPRTSSSGRGFWIRASVITPPTPWRARSVNGVAVNRLRLWVVTSASLCVLPANPDKEESRRADSNR